MSSTLATPLLIYVPFGVNASNPTYINLPIPVASQIGLTVNAASFTDGFPPSTMTPEASGGLPFFGQDLNGILWMITAYCANFAAGALSKYNSTLAANIAGYPVGAVVVNTESTGFWINESNGNATNPDTGGSNWLPMAGIGQTGPVALAGANVTLSALQSVRPYISLNGTLTSNVTLFIVASAGQQWVISNICTGGFTVTVAAASGGSGVTVPATGPGAPTAIYFDGTNIRNTGVSTAGLAPIASPGLTGTPTAPTATPAATNNTQIANTAFVQSAITAALAAYALKASPIFTGTPAAPTAAPGTNTTQLATTAFVTAAVAAAAVQRKSGTFNCINGTVTVSYGFTFATAPRVFVQWKYANPDVGYVVPGSETTTGFQYANGNSGLCNWFATTD